MRRHESRIAGLLVTVLLAGGPAPLAGQARSTLAEDGLAIGAKVGLYGTYVTDEVEPATSSLGIEGLARFTTAHRVALGLSAHYTTFDAAPVSGGPLESREAQLDVVSVYAQPTVFPTLTSIGITPLGLRVGRVEKTGHQDGTAFVARGWAFGAAAGVQSKLSRRIAVEGDLTFDHVWFGDGALDGVRTPDTAVTGWSLRVNVGVLFAVAGMGS